MKKLVTTLALGASAFAVCYTTPSHAQEKAAVATTETTTTAVPYTPPAREVYVNRIEHRPNRTMLWTGVTVFTITYTASVVAGGIAGDRIEDKNLFIPLVGPWLDIGQRNCEFRGCDDSQENVFKAMIIGSGILQGAGAILTISSFFVPQTTTAQAAVKTKPEIHVAPVSYAAGAGIGAVGRF